MSFSPSALTNPSVVSVNQRGEITPEQREALISANSSNGWPGCILAAVLTVIVVATVGKFLEQNPVLGMIIIVGILIVSSLAMGRIQSIPVRHRLQNAHAEPVSGEVVWWKN